MRVALMTAGSRGDVAPYTGLAHRLAAGGHSVTVVTHASFAKLVTASGAAFHPLPVDPRAELESARGRRLHRSRTGAGKLARVIGLARAVVGRMADGLVESARHSDALLLSASLAPLGHAVAQELGLPSMGVYLQPLAPTRAFAPPVTGTRSWGGPANLLAGHAVNHAVDRVFADATRTAVRELLRGARGHGRAAVRTGHRARERQGWRVHHGFSPLVVPRPGDWRAGLTVDGYWWPHDPPEARLPDRLPAFLDAGPPPVFVGLGSATVPDPARLSTLLVRALRAAGLRGVVQRGWGGLRAEGAGEGDRRGERGGGEDMLTVDEVPHALLFPRMAAVVHHAGAGTTAAGLRAGVPAVPVPIQFDEAFWASRLTALGVSPGAVPLRRLDERALTAALVEATRRPSYRERAAEVAARLRAEDGAGAVLASVDGLAKG
ncbi:glycosyltransferase [Streptomyces sp. NPDC054796]